MEFIPVMGKLNFQFSVLQYSSMILICWFAAQETFIIINVENSLYFVEPMTHLF